MRRRRQYVQYTVFALIAIGFLSSLAANPGGWIIPLAVFGVVFYLWKFPPNREKTKGKTKKARFRVIEGNKSDDSQEPPRYH